MKYLQTEAILIHKFEIYDHDLLTTWFSPEFGKITCKAPGAKKAKSKFTGHLELLNFNKIQLYKNKEYYLLTQSETIQVFSELKSDFHKIQTAYEILHILNKIPCHQEQNALIFQLFLKTLHLLEGPKYQIAFGAFKLQILKLMGLIPELKNCSSCQNPNHAEQEIFLNNKGEFLCQNCHDLSETISNIDFKNLKICKFLTDHPIEYSQQLNLEPEQLSSFQAFLKNIIGIHIPELHKAKTILQ